MTRGYQSLRRYTIVFMLLGTGMGLYALWTTYSASFNGVNAFWPAKTVSTFGPFEMGKEFPITQLEVGESHYPVVAWTGSGYFVAWQTNVRGDFDIDGRLISPDGKPLGKAAFPVAPLQGDQYFAAVAWGKSGGLVVWEDHRDVNPGIYGARVTGDGKILDPKGIPLVTGPELRQYPRVSWDGRQFLVSWEEERPAPQQVDILGLRVDPEGRVLDHTPIPIGAHAGDQFWSSVATNGSVFFVVWTSQQNPSSDEYDIYGTRVDGSGKVLDPKGIPISRASRSQEYPHVAWDGSRFWVVWADHRKNGSVAIYGTQVEASGTVRDPEGIRLSQETGRRAFPFVLPLASDRALVMWEEDTVNGRDLFGSLVQGRSKVLFANQIPLAVRPGMKHPLRADRFQDRILIVWQEKRSAVANLYGRLLKDQ